MLWNPIHIQLENMKDWQHLTFMACLCERMYPNYQVFCLQTGFGSPAIYRCILDLIWENLLVKDSDINFDNQLEKFENAIPSSEAYSVYGVYPAIDACVALSEVIHSHLTGEMSEHAITVSKMSVRTVVMLEMTQADKVMTDDELNMLPAVKAEWDIQWEVLRLLADCKKYNLELIKGLRADLREAAFSNIGVNLIQ